MAPMAFLTPSTPLLSTFKSSRRSRPSISPTTLSMSLSEQTSEQSSTPLSRRAFVSLSTSLLLLPTLPALADISALVAPYKDLPKGFTILRPNGWNEFEGSPDAYDIKWQDVIQPMEFITVLTSPIAKEKNLSDIGSANVIGNKIAAGRGGKLVQAAEKDLDGVPAYLFEIENGSSHQLTLLAVNKQKLYSVNANCLQSRWGKRERLLRGVVDSFRPKL